MKASVLVEKSFDESKRFTKEWESGDLKEFFTAEGNYVDKLVGVLDSKGEKGAWFTVTYTVTVEK